MSEKLRRDLDGYLDEVEEHEIKIDRLLVALRDELYEDLDQEIYELKRRYHDKYADLNDWEINDIIKEVFDELF